MKSISGKKYTAKELAAQFSCDVRTIQRIGNELFGKAEKGVTRYFDEAQTTLLLERLKHPGIAGKQAVTSTTVAQVETELSLEIQIAIVERKAKELWKRKAEKEEARAIRAETRMVELTVENERIHDDLRHANQKLELVGLHLTDRDDMRSLYRR
jgi:hypothetical protein